MSYKLWDSPEHIYSSGRDFDSPLPRYLSTPPPLTSLRDSTKHCRMSPTPSFEMDSVPGRAAWQVEEFILQ